MQFCPEAMPRGTMDVLAFVTQKGGSGKSTLAAATAVAAFEQGVRVFILELDRQGTLRDWANARKAEDGPEFEHVGATGALGKALDMLREAGYGLVIIDTAATLSPETNVAMRIADLCLIPCRPTAIDLRGCLATVQTLVRLDRKFAFVLSQCPPRSPRVAETYAGLSALGLVAEPPIVSRADHQDAMAAGQGVTEFNTDGPAAAEIRQLWSWIHAKLSSKEKLRHEVYQRA
jgi:chromosome partitioning protein